MKRAWSVVKWLLIAWGTLCFLGALALGGLLVFRLGPSNSDSRKTASEHDVRYVLNWCQLGDERIEEVLHSYVSARSFTGDHLDAHAIRITHVDTNELKKDDFGADGRDAIRWKGF